MNPWVLITRGMAATLLKLLAETDSPELVAVRAYIENQVTPIGVEE